MSFIKPNWWDPNPSKNKDLRYEEPQHQDPTPQESPPKYEVKSPTEDEKYTVVDNQNFSVILQKLLSNIESQKCEIEELQYHLNIEKKNNNALIQKVSQLEESNNNLRKVLRCMDNPIPDRSKDLIVPHLFISQDAPKAIFDAVYKTVIKIHHPDLGGSEDIMKEINLIKDSMYKLKGW